MSSAELIATYDLAILGSRAGTAATALVSFEYFITFKYEIELLWGRKWSASTWIFVFNRYLLIANAIFLITPSAAQICEHSLSMNILYFFTAGGFYTLPTHVFTILRSLALLQGHPWRLAATATLVALSLTAVTLGSFAEFQTHWTYVNDPILGSSCVGVGYSVPLGFINCVTKTISIIAIISGSLVLAITLMQTARQVQRASMLGLRTTLSEVLLRDGSIFFFIILLQDIYATVFTLNESLLNSALDYATTPLLNVLPPVLLSRFIINLRQVDSPGTNPSVNQRSSRFSIPNFHMPNMDDVVGNLGQPLDFAEYRMDDEGDAQNDGDDATAEPQHAAGLHTSWETDFTEVMRSPRAGRDNTANVDVLGTDVELEPSFVSVLSV